VARSLPEQPPSTNMATAANAKTDCRFIESSGK
jgi:hypothetical protein